MKRTKQKLIDDLSDKKTYAYEFVLAGLKFSFTERIRFFTEAGYGDFCLFKTGISVGF